LKINPGSTRPEKTAREMLTACGGKMRVIALITDFSVLDRIIKHVKLSFVAEKPPRPAVNIFRDLLLARRSR
jgi:hypothetical protein